MISPPVDQRTGEFRPIVGKQIARGAALLDQAIDYRHRVFASQPLADFNG
jgi:hypothetical protein